MWSHPRHRKTGLAKPDETKGAKTPTRGAEGGGAPAEKNDVIPLGRDTRVNKQRAAVASGQSAPTKQ